MLPKKKSYTMYIKQNACIECRQPRRRQQRQWWQWFTTLCAHSITTHILWVYSRYNERKSHTIWIWLFVWCCGGCIFNFGMLPPRLENWLLYSHVHVAPIFHLMFTRALCKFRRPGASRFKFAWKWTTSLVHSLTLFVSLMCSLPCFGVCIFAFSQKSMKYCAYKILCGEHFTWNMSVSASSLYSTITAWFRDSVYDIECWFASKIAFDVWGDWTI